MPSLRRVLRTAALVAALGLAYVGGVVTGVVGSDDGPAPRAGVIDEAADRISSQAARPVDRDALERAAVEGMLRTLGDRWSSYYGKGEFASFQAALEGQYSGVGLWLRPAPAGGVEVGSVQPGSPAARARLRTGDALLRVGSADVRRASVSDTASLLRGTPRSQVDLVVRRSGSEVSASVTRATFSSHDVVVEHLQGGIARVQLTQFSRGVGREVRSVLASSAPPAGIVLDLRDNPGGLLDEAVEVASAFLDGGPVVSYERRGRPPQTLDAVTGGDVTTPLVVLVNSSSASASEVVTAALQDRNRAVVVGSRTFGKGTVQEPTKLSDGSALELTVGRYLTPSGRSLEKAGVEPDVLVPATEPAELGESRAIDVLAGLHAALGSGRG